MVCKVLSIQRNYIQVELEDYRGREDEERAQGMVHISEVSNRWVRNITSLVTVGQRVVLAVIKVNERKGYLDLSLRRVNKVQNTSVMNAWKYAQKLDGLLEYFCEQHKITLNDLYERCIWALIDHFGDIRTAFEEIKQDGIKIFDEIEGVDLDDSMKESLYHVVMENIQISKVYLTVEYDIRTYAGNGIDLIKEAFTTSKRIHKPKGLESEFHYIGAPIYRLDIEANDFPDAEKYLTKVTDKLKSVIGNQGTIESTRDDLSNKQ